MYQKTFHDIDQNSPAAKGTLGFTSDEENIAKKLFTRGIHNENAVTNQVFFDRHPVLRGQSLTPGSALAREWITIRNLLVRPKLATLTMNIPKRPCCIFAPEAPTGNNIADPRNLGKHRDASEAWGIVYSGRAGFIDLGHLREECDLTEFIWIKLQGAGGAPTTIPTIQGEAKIIRQIPRYRWLLVAQAIAFDDGFGHEIFSYDIKSPGGHNSAFSPEDLCSNFLGTIVARRAISHGGPFAARVTVELNRILKHLQVQSPIETRKAFDLVNSRWVDFIGPWSVLRTDYLKRRNFTRIPFKAGHSSDAKTPPWLWATFGDATRFYTYSHTLGKTIPKSNFTSEIRQIRANAKILYGDKFDKP